MRGEEEETLYSIIIIGSCALVLCGTFLAVALGISIRIKASDILSFYNRPLLRFGELILQSTSITFATGSVLPRC